MAARKPKALSRKNTSRPKKPTPATRYHLVLFQQGSNHEREGDFIDRDIVRKIQGYLDEAIHTSPSHTEIDIWMESYGGDAHAAYKLVLDLRSRCSFLQAVVPDIAKSAATLLTLGVDNIFMGAAAELGPLDVQIEHPDREGTIVSALDVADSLGFIGNTAIDLVLGGGGRIVKYTGLQRTDVLNGTLKFMAEFLQPMMQKLDPHLFHQAANQLHVAKRYARNILRKRNIKAMDEDVLNALIDHLVNHYPAHEFVISREEAKAFGLPVHRLATYPRLKELKRVYKTFTSLKDNLICVVEDAVLDQAESLASSVEGEGKNHETSLRITDEEVVKAAIKANGKAPKALKAGA